MAHTQCGSDEAPLIAWVKTFPVASKVESLADLTDGYVLSQILEDFDPDYAIKNLEKNASPKKWLNKKMSLDAVYKSLLSFTRRNCEDLDSANLDTNIDLNAIAEHDDTQQMINFLTIFLMAAVNGPKREKYVLAITENLNPAIQAEIMWTIKQHSPPEESAVESAGATVASPPPPPPLKDTDPDLALEAKHASLMTEHRSLKHKNGNLLSENEHLRESNHELRTLLVSKDSELSSFKRDSDQAGFIKSLQNRIDEDQILIAHQEQQIDGYRVSKERQQRELNSLRPKALRLAELEDNCKVLQSDNASLVKKANMVDHFKMKLESLGATERENTNLRDHVDILQKNQRHYNSVHAENEKLKNTKAEYETKFSYYETEVNDLTRTCNVYKDEVRNKDIQIETLQVKQASDEKMINELQEQIRTGNTNPFPPNSPADGPGQLTLEEELKQAPDATPNYLLEISRLQAENQLLRSGSAGTTNATLRIDLEESERARKRLSENLRDLTEKQAITHKQLEAVLTTSSNEKYVIKAVDAALKQGPLKTLTENFYRDEAIAKTRDLERKATEELKTTKAKLADIQSELTSQYRELLATKADLAAVDRDEIDALDDLKATNEIITSSLTNDLQLVQTRHKNLITDYEQQRSHLVEALLDRENLRKDIESVKNGRPARPISMSEPDEHDIAEADAAKEKAKTMLQSLEEQSEEQEMIIQDLQRRLKDAEEARPEVQKAATEALIKNLTRENSMMATAWYDLSSRLQSNHLVLQRRQDMPKSWLSRQRLMVNGASRR